MTQQELIELDPEFIWDKACKRNYCTLINISISQATLKSPKFYLDGKKVHWEYPEEPLFFIQYREWRNTNWFGFGEEVHDRKTLLWTTRKKAEDWLHGIGIPMSGLQWLSKSEAFGIAQINLEMGERARERFSKIKMR